MKKLILILIGLCFIIGCSAQSGKGWRGIPYKANFQDSTNFTKVPLLNGTYSFVTSYNTNLTGLTKMQRLQIGGLAAAIIDSITNDGSGLKFYSNGQPVSMYIPAGNGISISAIKTIPKLVPSSGDTSNYPIPERGGIIYIDSTGGNSYLSLKQGRNNWQELANGKYVDATSSIQGQFNALSHPTITPKTSSYSLQVADGNTIITMNSSGSTNLTIPLNSSQPIPIGSFIEIHNIGSGTMTFVVTGGVTAYYAALHLAQNASAVLRKLGTDIWMIDGNLN